VNAITKTIHLIRFGLPGDWAYSFFTQPAADESAALFAPASASDRAGMMALRTGDKSSAR